MKLTELLGSLLLSALSAAAGMMVGMKVQQRIDQRRAQAAQEDENVVEWAMVDDGPIAPEEPEQRVEITFPLDETPAPAEEPIEAPAPVETPAEEPTEALAPVETPAEEPVEAPAPAAAPAPDAIAAAMAALEEDFSDLEPQTESRAELEQRLWESGVNANPVELGAAETPRTADGKIDVTRIASPEDFADWEQTGCKS